MEAIQIDAVVTDADGRPVRNLTADEFVILENGTPRPLTAFSLVDIPIERSHGPTEGWTATPDVLTNDGPERRLYLIALDEVAPEYALRTRVFLRRFLEEHFQPHDVAAVVLTGRGLVTDGQPFTGDPQLVLDAVDKFSGSFLRRPECTDWSLQFSGPLPGGGPRVVPMPRSNTNDLIVRNRLERLRALVEQLAQIPGGRKTLLYFTQCIGFDMFDALDYAGGVLGLAAEQAHAVMVAATQGSVVVYPIDPSGLTVEGDGLELMQDRARGARHPSWSAGSRPRRLPRAHGLDPAGRGRDGPAAGAGAGPGAAVTLTRPPDTSTTAASQWLRILTQLELPAGQYQVRVAAGGATRAGSVVYDLEVPDFTRDGLMLSGLALTSMSAQTVQTLRPALGGSGRAANCRPPSCVVPLATGSAPAADDPLLDALPAPPTTARAFDRSDTLMLFTEVYENVRRAPAHTIEVTTSLRREDGEVVVAATEPRASTAPRRPSGGYGFTAQLTLQDIPPGRYLLQVDARSDASSATASRAVPITVP